MRPTDSLRRQMLAIALTAASVLLFEIAITRVLSVVLWYHWAFLSVSLAMVGLGAPGVWFSFRPPTPRLRDGLLIAGGISLPIATAAVISVSPTLESGQVLFCMAALLLPFLCLGAATCILLLQAPAERIAPVYGADLMGASLAALLIIPAMERIPTPILIALFGLLPLAAAWVLGAKRMYIGAATGLLALLVAWGTPLQVTHNKSYDETEHTPFLEKWTSTARLTFFDHMFFTKHQGEFAWGQGTKANTTRVREQYWMEQDGSAGTPVTRFDGDLDDVGFLLNDVTTVAYPVAQPTTVAVIGAGGGRDILSALVSGATSVDAVELNPHIIEIVSGELGQFSGDPYHLPGVHAFASEGRAFLTQTDRRYDMIQISMIDSWAATAAGAFSLSENNLYTKEAYRLYWSRLTDRGVISTSRWSKGRAALELPRLAVLVAASLRDAGVEHPEKHIAVVDAGRVATLIASKRPIEGDLRLRLLKTCRNRGFSVRYFPRAREHENEPKDALRRAIEDGPGWWAERGLDLTAPIDDRPFFFQVLPPLAPIDRQLAEDHGFNAEAVAVLQLLMVVLLAVTVVLFFAPFALARWMPKGPGRWRGSGYFAAIGLGFMLVEIPWLQRFILFLGHPSLAATVVLGAMLLGTGIGSLLSTRFGTARLRHYGLLIPLVLAGINVGLSGLFESALGLPFAGRVAVTVTLLVPVGIGLGLFFPLGMLAFGDRHKAWFWAINGASGVLASVVSLAAAMAFGFTAVAWAGIATYAAAWSLLVTWRGERHTER